MATPTVLYRQQKHNVFDQPEREELEIATNKPWAKGIYSEDRRTVRRKAEHKPDPVYLKLESMQYTAHRFMARAGYEGSTKRFYFSFTQKKDLDNCRRNIEYASVNYNVLRLYV